MNGDVLPETRFDAAPSPPARAAWWWRVVGPLALPLVLWWIGSFFLLGNLGLWVDDYSFHVRDPATDTYELRRLFVPPPGPFWRPIHIVVSQDLITLAWHENWLMHGICAAVHALNVVLLFRLLRRLGVRRTAASVCGMIFLTAPAGFQVIFWPSTISTGISLAIFQGTMLMFIRSASKAEWGLRRWAITALLGPIIFAIGCWYEQVMTMVACLPFIYAAVAPRLALRKHAARLVFSIGMAMAGGVLYAVLLMSTAQTAIRGSKESFATTSQLWSKVLEIAEQVRYRLMLEWFLPGAVRTGWATMGREWQVGIGAVVLLMLSGAAWLAWRWRLIGEEQRAEAAAAAGGPERGGDSGLLRDWWRLGLVMLAGLAVFVCAWLPAVVIYVQRTESRLCYVPIFGLMLMLGPVLELPARCLRRRPGIQRMMLMGVGVGALPVSVVGAIALVGVQTAFQKRYQMDQTQLGVLRQLVPNPSPQTVFMPLKVDDWPTATESVLFDTITPGVWDAPWSADFALRYAYRNGQIWSIAYSRWRSLLIDEVNDESFVYLGPGLQPDRKHVVPWSTVVAFAAERPDRFRLVEEVVFTRKGVEFERVEMPLVKQARERSPGMDHLFVRGFVVELGP